MGPEPTLPFQVQEGQACPSGLELPTVLLQVAQNRRAQEQVGAGWGCGRGQGGTPSRPGTPIFPQLLWDLELLTGAGLGLFWPPRAQCAWSQRGKPRGRTGGDSEPLMCRVSRGSAEAGVCDTGNRSGEGNRRVGSGDRWFWFRAIEGCWEDQ